MVLCESIPAASTPPPPANPGHLLHDESGGGDHLAVDSVPAPEHLQTTKNFIAAVAVCGLFVS